MFKYSADYCVLESIAKHSKDIAVESDMFILACVDVAWAIGYALQPCTCEVSIVFQWEGGLGPHH